MVSGGQMWHLLNDALQQIRHIVGAIEFRCQCDDVATPANTEIIPLVEFGVYLELGFGFLSHR